jgi:hypothetical protein
MKEYYQLNDFSLPGFLSHPYNAAYGDNYVAALYCGFDEIPKPVNGEWQHGWIGPERNIHSEFVIGSDGRSGTRKYKNYFVARNDQSVFLKEHGFKHVSAIGLPIVYTEQPIVERKQGSLLVMPVHSLSDTEESWNDEEYASYIESISHHFSEIVLCVHKSCLNKSNWIGAFSKRNIKFVLGADPDDCNSYNRLAILFSRFEYVTSNDMGSHLAYAAFFGAKPSIAGPRPRFERKDFEKTLFYANAPEVLDIVEKWYKEEFYKKTYPFFYKTPHQAEQIISWAEFQLGLPEKKNPRQLRNILGWTIPERIFFKIIQPLIHK